ncbi:vacuolar transporter [Emiliania huxleyi CCMP1516]|uniref:Amino acid transporter transmembrane domain-containing protein n=4 Tax=Emiliania huxleyi TaxID=2903 RepID=A0A0D3JY32_EMIH1|nr:vacuolar transporter [Emiliania huxleyi CCMP1516]EOD28417.1 vacuolar transporter [Emiliania huxleyi CCMP1516]|eukprot:XP_005780846.1 vacuolar transporter [Emiliania huxleyi CCMP1516]
MSSQASSALLADAPPTTAGSPSETSSPSARPDRPLLVRDAGFWTAVLTLCNAALGAGLLSLPYAVASAGLLVGSLSTCVLICASFASLCVIMGLMAQAGPSVTSFGGLVRWGCGPAASNVVDGFVFLNSFGACVGYLVLLGDVVPPIVLDAVPAAKSMSAGQLRAAAASVASLPCLLLSMLRRISALRFTAGVAVFACFFTAGLLTAQAVQHPCRPGDCYDGAGRNGWCTAAQAANASSAAACYADRPTAGVSLWPESAAFVFAEMRPALRESRPRTAVAASAVSLLAFFYLTVGAVGFLRFGAQTQGDCLQNFSPTDASAGIARVAVALTALSAFPMQHFPARGILHRLWRLLVDRAVSTRPPTARPAGMSTLFLLLEPVGWVGVTLPLALVLGSDLSFVFELSGALVVNGVVFLVPAALLLALRRSRHLAVAFLLLGASLTVSGTFISIDEKIRAARAEVTDLASRGGARGYVYAE